MPPRGDIEACGASEQSCAPSPEPTPQRASRSLALMARCSTAISCQSQSIEYWPSEFEEITAIVGHPMVESLPRVDAAMSGWRKCHASNWNIELRDQRLLAHQLDHRLNRQWGTSDSSNAWCSYSIITNEWEARSSSLLLGICRQCHDADLLLPRLWGDVDTSMASSRRLSPSSLAIWIMQRARRC